MNKINRKNFFSKIGVALAGLSIPSSLKASVVLPDIIKSGTDTLSIEPEGDSVKVRLSRAFYHQTDDHLYFVKDMESQVVLRVIGLKKGDTIDFHITCCNESHCQRGTQHVSEAGRLTYDNPRYEILNDYAEGFITMNTDNSDEYYFTVECA